MSVLLDITFNLTTMTVKVNAVKVIVAKYFILLLITIFIYLSM